jgi:anti-sigma factor RsiW
MHGSIRSELEKVLAGQTNAGDVKQHLAACGECAAAVAAMRQQNELFRTLRADDDAEPMAGFYSRVMQRIEEKAKDSIWSVFVYSPFGKRLAFASLSIAVALGSYVVAEEKLDGHLLSETAVAQQVHYDVPMEGDQSQLRDAVLQNFAAHDASLK